MYENQPFVPDGRLIFKIVCVIMGFLCLSSQGLVHFTAAVVGSPYPCLLHHCQRRLCEARRGKSMLPEWRLSDYTMVYVYYSTFLFSSSYLFLIDFPYWRTWMVITGWVAEQKRKPERRRQNASMFLQTKLPSDKVGFSFFLLLRPLIVL